ncbi:unnamed protein product [Calypogeia fissa]
MSLGYVLISSALPGSLYPALGIIGLCYGRLYDMEAAKDYHEVNEENLECYGAHCFRLTFIIMAAVSLFGCSVCLVLVHRTKAFYARIVQNSLAT